MARALRIEVTFLSDLQRVAGRETTWLDVGNGATVARALAMLRERMPAFAGMEVTALVNGKSVATTQVLQPGDSLFLMPPGP